MSEQPTKQMSATEYVSVTSNKVQANEQMDEQVASRLDSWLFWTIVRARYDLTFPLYHCLMFTLFIGFQLGVELTEELFQRHSGDIGQHVESSSVGHSHDHALDAQRRRLVDDRLK